MKVLIGLAVAAAAMAQQPQAARGQERLPVTEEGVASFYGWKLHGRRMANGRRFNALGISAASRTLPLGCRVRVTNLANGRSVELTIEDRGPYISGRIIDVSLGAAQRLGMTRQGLARVRISLLPGRR